VFFFWDRLDREKGGMGMRGVYLGLLLKNEKKKKVKNFGHGFACFADIYMPETKTRWKTIVEQQLFN